MIPAARRLLPSFRALQSATTSYARPHMLPPNLVSRPLSSSSSSSSSYAEVDHQSAYEESVSSAHGDALRLAYEVDESFRRSGKKIAGGREEVHPYKSFAAGAPAYGYVYDDGEMERVRKGGRGMASAGLVFEECEKKIDGDDDGTTEAEFWEEGDIEAVEGDEMEPGNVIRTDGLSAGVVDSFAVIAFAPPRKRNTLPVDEARKARTAHDDRGLNAAPTQQYKVSPNDVVVSHKLRPVDKWSVGSVHILTGENLLLIGTPRKTFVGLPYLGEASSVVGKNAAPSDATVDVSADATADDGETEFGVVVRVEEITRDAKTVAFKRRRRKHSKRKKGFRRQVTLLRVLRIISPDSGKKEGVKAIGF
mmetsp:Transcript_26826/g.53546  ORF Transcript_26826/g.53546 Transcript_26826/m.53546 type:complete len:364 (+) Transcript_26826:53-1144(+)